MSAPFGAMKPISPFPGNRLDEVMWSASGDASIHGVFIMLGRVVEANIALVAVVGESALAW